MHTSMQVGALPQCCCCCPGAWFKSVTGKAGRNRFDNRVRLLQSFVWRATSQMQAVQQQASWRPCSSAAQQAPAVSTSAWLRIRSQHGMSYSLVFACLAVRNADNAVHHEPIIPEDSSKIDLASKDVAAAGDAAEGATLPTSRSLRHCRTGSIKLCQTPSMKLNDSPFEQQLELEFETGKDPELAGIEKVRGPVLLLPMVDAAVYSPAGLSGCSRSALQRLDSIQHSLLSPKALQPACNSRRVTAVTVLKGTTMPESHRPWCTPATLFPCLARAACCVVQEYAAEVGHLAGKIKHHVPLAVLFKDHWQGILLQFLAEAGLGSCFSTWFR